METQLPVAEVPQLIMLVDSGRSDAPAGFQRHRHELGELDVIEHGLMAVEIGSGWWVIPSGRVGWLPPRWPHAGRSFGITRVLALYLDAGRAAALPASPRVWALTPFVAALFRRLHDLGAAEPDRRSRLLDVLCDELVAAGEEPLHLPMPREPRLVRMCRTLMEHPADPRGLDQWAAAIGLSRRSLTRHLVAETGLSFGRWRTQARLMAAVRLLAERRPVTDVALSLGFESVSAFIAGFRRHFGTTPMRYIQHRPGVASGGAERSAAAGKDVQAA